MRRSKTEGVERKSEVKKKKKKTRSPARSHYSASRERERERQSTFQAQRLSVCSFSLFLARVHVSPLLARASRAPFVNKEGDSEAEKAIVTAAVFSRLPFIARGSSSS